MFSHTESLEEQAQKLTSVQAEQPADPQPVKPVADSTEQQHDSTEPSVDEQVSQHVEPTSDLIAEAEMRGFQRAMALRAEELFNRPTSDAPTFPKPDPDESAASDVVFLARVRRSVWD